MFYVTTKLPGLFLKNINIKLYKKKNYLIFLDKKLKMPFNKFFQFNKNLIPIVKDFNGLNSFFFTSLTTDFILGEYFGFCHKICLSGLGFKFLLSDSSLILKLGITPNIKIEIPSSIRLYTKKKQEIEVLSKDKNALYKFVDFLISLKKMDVYTLKGIYSYRKTLKKKVSSKLSK